MRYIINSIVFKSNYLRNRFRNRFRKPKPFSKICYLCHYLKTYLMKHVTIKDVAKKLNVSVSSVSKAFNDRNDIKKETKEIILKVGKEMGYHPNPIAKKLSQQKTFNVGVVVPEFINAFFPEVIIGIQDILINKGYQVLIMQSNESYEMELKNVQVLEENMVDGLIISLSGETKNIDYYKSLIDQNYPIVFFNRYNDTLSASKVVFDDYKWSFFVTEHLIKQGYKKIFHLSAHQYILLAKERIRGYKKAMNKYHLPLEPTWIVEAGLTVEEGEMTMQKLIDNNNLPEAITCATDMLALGVVKCCKRNGIKIPDDIALTGFSEIPFAELIDPPLTSVLQPTYEMGEIAAKLLLKQIDNESTIPETVILNGTLNIRQSSQKLQNKGE
jgi:LacI family transcriptional regulator